jgi:hypothetical protein
MYAQPPLEIMKQFEHFYDAIQPAQENNEDVYAWFSGVPHPFLNVVIRLSGIDALRDADALIERYSENKPMSFWISPENQELGPGLIARGFSSITVWPVMTWDVKEAAPVLCDIRPAQSDVFYPILSTVYAVDKQIERDFSKLMDKAACENTIFYADDQPTSIASLFVHGSVAEIFNEASLPGQRAANEEMIRFLMHRAHTLGLKQLFTMSSPEAEELYALLGFKKVFDIAVYASSYADLE